VLDALAGVQDGVQASAIARSLGLSTSTLSLILSTLAEAHYVERLPDRSWKLGVGLMRLASALQGRFPILAAANEELAQLAATFGCSGSLSRATPDGQDVILTVGDTDELGIRPGVTVPGDAPHGTMVMAWRSPPEIERWLSTVTPALQEIYERALSEVRQLGYGVYGIRAETGSMIDQLRGLLQSIQAEPDADHLQGQLDQLAAFVGSRIYTKDELSEDVRRDVSHLIAPVFAADRQPRYLLSLHLMRRSVAVDERQRHVDALLRSARMLTAQIGGKCP
jgi:DNA-binding IclR family transcriptional regulator